MDNLKEELQVTAEAASAEDSKTAAAELGKFKNVQALMEAYNALEAEFTRRSQRLKELEANKENAPPVQETGCTDNGASPSPVGSAEQTPRAITEEEKNAVITEYLNGVRANRSVPFVTGGGAVSVARRTPSSISDAGRLAKDLFNKGDRQ